MASSAWNVPTEQLVLLETAGSLLRGKDSRVFWVRPEETVYEAIAMMADLGIGALLVVERGRLAGIVSERDYARKVILRGRSSRQTAVREIMTSPVITITGEATLEDCMRIVTERRIRHLPVMDGDRIAGMISIGDLVKAIMSAQADTIRQLSSYITGSYPA